MNRITREPSERAPLVDFDFNAGHLVMKGESYPEDAAAFFGPLLESLRRYLEQPAESVCVYFEMAYFNSSSAKALMNMFQMLEDAAAQGHTIRINWFYHEDDDTMAEFGEDFSEDMEHAEFLLRVIE